MDPDTPARARPWQAMPARKVIACSGGAGLPATIHAMIAR